MLSLVMHLFFCGSCWRFFERYENLELLCMIAFHLGFQCCWWKRAVLFNFMAAHHLKDLTTLQGKPVISQTHSQHTECNKLHQCHIMLLQLPLHQAVRHLTRWSAVTISSNQSLAANTSLIYGKTLSFCRVMIEHYSSLFLQIWQSERVRWSIIHHIFYFFLAVKAMEAFLWGLEFWSRK